MIKVYLDDARMVQLTHNLNFLLSNLYVFEVGAHDGLECTAAFSLSMGYTSNHSKSTLPYLSLYKVVFLKLLVTDFELILHVLTRLSFF